LWSLCGRLMAQILVVLQVCKEPLSRRESTSLSFSGGLFLETVLDHTDGPCIVLCELVEQLFDSMDAMPFPRIGTLRDVVTLMSCYCILHGVF
jgi:hypothetical protein